MTKSVLVPVADGSEEIEFVCLVDTLRRAGARVTLASADGPAITASRGLRVVADRTLAEAAALDYDLVAIPGGMPGSARLRDDPHLRALLARHAGRGRPYAAICAAPAVVLAELGLLDGRAATAHPGFVAALPGGAAAPGRVVVDAPGGGRSTVVTSRGPGTALEFALELVALLYGPGKAAEVALPMVVAGGL